MIRINIDDNKKREIKDKHINDFGKDYCKITTKLDNLKMYKNFYSYFIDQNSNAIPKPFDKKKIRHLLCVDSKKELIKIIDTMEDLIKKDANNNQNMIKQIKEKIRIEFENLFKNFSQRNWAYDFLRLIDCRVCPYCNRMYTYTVSKCGNNRGTRPELDHYFSKNDYPYLAISIFNLIPSCSICNKGKSDQCSDFICYPYEESFDDKISFTVDFNDLDAIFSNSGQLVISLDDKGDSNNKKYIDKYNSCFKIDKLYAQHDDYARELIKKFMIYEECYIKSIYDIAPEIFNNSYEEFKQVFISNYLEPDEMNRRPLAKLTQDMLNEFGF